MRQLPATTFDQALEFARQEVGYFRENPIPIMGVNAYWFDSEDNRKLARQVMKRYALQHPTHMMAIVEYARAGWSLADDALRELIIEFVDRGEQMPTYLAAYSMDIARGGPRRLPARKKEDRFLRDIAITIIIQRIIERFGLNPYGRNRSACSVVAEALGKSEGNPSYKAVAEIWRRYGRAIGRAKLSRANI